MMKSVLATISITSILATAHPVIAASQVKGYTESVAQKQSVKEIFAGLNLTDDVRANQEMLNEASKKLIDSGVQASELIEFAKADMTASQAIAFDESLSLINEIGLNNMSAEELNLVISEITQSDSSGAHWNSRACYSYGSFLGITAMVTGVIGFIWALSANSVAAEKQDEIDARNEIIADNQADIDFLRTQGIDDSSYIIQQIETENRKERYRVEQLNEEKRDAKDSQKIGLYGLGAAAVLGVTSFAICN